MLKIYRFEKTQKELKNIKINRIQTIKEGKLWLSSPDSFNDLDDSTLTGLWKSPLGMQEFDSFLKAFDLLHPSQSNHSLSPSLISKLIDYIKPNEPNISKTLHDASAISAIRKELAKNSGMCCFFGGFPDDALMWAHYADNHKGYCVEYEVSEFEPEYFGLNKVTYTSKLPEFSATEFLLSPYESIARVLYSKSLIWSHEQEWRYIEYQEILNREISLPNFIKPSKIVTGTRFNDNDEIVINELNDMGKHLNLEIMTIKAFKAKS